MTLVKDTHGTNLTIYSIWQVREPTPAPIPLSLTPIAPTPDTPAPAAKSMTQRLQARQYQTGHPGWGLWTVEHGTGFIMSVFPWRPSATFTTLDACEGQKRQHIQQMAARLATQFQARAGGPTMTETGWREGATGQPKPGLQH
jgi:hypothetical protein